MIVRPVVKAVGTKAIVLPLTSNPLSLIWLLSKSLVPGYFIRDINIVARSALHPQFTSDDVTSAGIGIWMRF